MTKYKQQGLHITQNTFSMRILFIFLLLPSLCLAQFSAGFAPVGAVWRDQSGSTGGTGYEITTVMSQNVLGNTVYRPIQTTRYQNFIFSNNHADTLVIRGDSVFLTNPPHLLFDFAAVAGSNIVFRGSNTNVGYAHADSVKNILFQGQSRRAIYYSVYCPVYPQTPYNAIVVAGYGLLNVHWSWDYDYCFHNDGTVYYNFLCYNDPNISYPENCIVGTQNMPNNDLQITVSPNPSSSFVKITAPKPILQLKITDLMGKTVLKQAENNTEATIFTQNLPQGLYFLTVNDVFVQKIAVVR